MQRIRIIVLKRDADSVTEVLGQLGAMELTKPREESPPSADVPVATERRERCRALKRRLESLMQWFQVPLPELLPGEEVRQFSLDDIARLMDAIEKEAEPVGKRLNALEQKIARAQVTIDQIAPYRELTVSPRELAQTSFLHVLAGDMPDDQIEPARAALPRDAILVPVGQPVTDRQTASASLSRVLALSSRRSRFALRTVVDEHQFRPQDLPTDYESAPASIYEQAQRERIASLAERDELQKPLSEIGKTRQADFTEAYRKVVREMSITEAEQNYGTTWATSVITGWCPRDYVERIREAMHNVTEGRSVFEARAATEDEIEQGLVPSHAYLPGILRPFQRMVRGYGIPAYREIEPTLMFAASFLLMFGVVFGDLGHGLCLLVIGLLLRLRTRDPGTADLGYVIAGAGLASALFGAFFQGSFFGMSLREMGWRLSLSMEPLRMGAGSADAAPQVVRYMLMAVGFGVALISLGVVLNVISRFRSGDYEAGLCERFGVAGIVFYWGALAVIIKLAVRGRSTADIWMVAGLVVLPLLVLAFHEAICAVLTRRPRSAHEAPAWHLFEGLLTLTETVTTYLANTLSFLRLAAFALSHVALCFTIFVLQGLVSEVPGGAVWSILIFLSGTALILGLEGLIVTIQIFRLEYYEFFTKFFQGGGRRFSPFTLDKSGP